MADESQREQQIIHEVAMAQDALLEKGQQPLARPDFSLLQGARAYAARPLSNSQPTTTTPPVVTEPEAGAGNNPSITASSEPAEQKS